MSSSNSSLLTDASKSASERNITDYELGIANHIAGGLDKHSKTELLSVPYSIISVAGDQTAVRGPHDLAGEYTTSTSKILKLLVKSNLTEYVVGVPALNEYDIFEDSPERVEFTTQPASTSVLLSGVATLSVSVAGAQPIVFQWRKDGKDIPLANSDSFSIPIFKESDVGTYTCVALNFINEVESDPATISLV